MLTKIEDKEMRGSHRYALYKCTCGTEKILRVSAVNSGDTKSCGCHRKKIAQENGKKVTTHGQTGTYLYWLWGDKIKGHSIWNSFEDFYQWAKDKWNIGLTIYSENGFYNEQSNFIKQTEAKSKNRLKTCLLKYGCESTLQSPDIKEKIKKSNIKKYGVENPAKTNIVKQHTIENNRKKYGVDFPQQLEENRIKQKRFAVEKIGFDSEEWARKTGISRSMFSQRVNKYGFDIAITLSKTQTAIEGMIQKTLDDLQIIYITDKLIGKYRPDFLIQKYNLIIETDGLYWHSDAVNKNYRYHREKLDEYAKLGYRALFFRENEIETKLPIINSIIKNTIKQSNRIFARKCSIIELNKDDRREFFNNNHLMGRGRGECYALEYDGKVICALQFTNRDGLVDISRFCNVLNVSVIGGYSRLIAEIVRKNNVQKIQTFVDKRYGTGDYLYKMGFNLITDRLSFVWVKNDKVYHRLQYRGNSGYKYGMYKLWDCGQAKFEKVI